MPPLLHTVRQKLAHISRDAGRALVVTPVEVAVALGMAVALSVAVERDDGDHWRWTFEAIMAGLLVLGFAFAASCMRHLHAIGPRLRWTLTGIGITGGVAYGAWVLDTTHATERWRWGFLAAALSFAIMVLPVAARRSTMAPRVLLWRFNMRLVERLFFVGLYTIVMYAGLALALRAVDGLFAIDLASEVYAHLASLLFVGMGPWLLVADIRRLTDAESPLSDGAVARAATAARWTIVPLLTVYSLILYAYAARVVVMAEVPSNVVSPLTLGAALLALMASFVLDPMHDRADHPWLARVIRWLPVAYLPLAPLALWALWLRIDQHGWTEFRFARGVAMACVTLCFAVAAAQLVRRRPPPLAAYLATFGVAALLSAFGPWGASAVSERSQLGRLSSDLNALGALTREGTIDVQGLHQRRREGRSTAQAASRVTYLVDHHGFETIEPLIPTPAPAMRKHVGRDVASALGLAPWHPPHMARRLELQAEGPRRVDAPGRLYTLSWPHHRGFDALDVEVRGEEITVRIAQDERWRGDLASALRREPPDVHADGRHMPISVPADDMRAPLLDDRGETRGHALLDRAVVRASGTDVEIIRLRGVVHVPRATGE